MKPIQLPAAIAISMIAAWFAWGQEAGPQKPRTVASLQQDFRKLELGMFIHYNMATYQGTQWVNGYPSPAKFDPKVETIDTDAWADAAQAAGMTYAVLTAKHVGGFCLWDSSYTTYDVMHPECPYQKDLVAQFVESFTSRGLKVGLYYCWRHPGFGPPAKYKVLPPECDPADHNLDEQIEFQKKQIAELVKKYPRVFYIWNDGLDPGIMPADDAQAFTRGLGPRIIASSNWWDWGKKGAPYLDIAVKETRHFPADNTYPGETCWKLQPGWFWIEGKDACAPAKRIIPHIETAFARNSNVLLNVGPDKTGKITCTKTLKDIGQWRRSR